MKKIIVFLFITAFHNSFAQKVNYSVSFPNINHHEAKIELSVSDISGRKAIFRMSRSSPGRYATHEFGKNVYDVKAFDKSGNSIIVTRTDGDVYEVPQHSGYIRLVYTLYGNYADGTYLSIDPSGIHLNMPAGFMWMKGIDDAPISIHFNIPPEWKWTIATQLKPTTDPLTFEANGLQYFMDCPTKIGNLKYKEWDITNPGNKIYHFRIAFDADGEDAVFTTFSKKVERIVKEAQAVYGETPAYDFGHYTFLASLNPYVHGDGMEHRNSTMISIPVNFNGDDFLLEVFAHEFFHCWNVERIRPKTLEPFNFEKSNMSNELWFAEGFTQYYGDLLVTRGGFEEDTSYAHTLEGLINIKLNTAGAKFYSPIDASRHAVFTDAGVAIDKTNYQNMFASYYPYGASIALALDLSLREKYSKTLDDLMQAAWKKYGKTEIPYNVSNLEELLADITQDKKFAADFFAKYIYGHEAIDYQPLLEKAGFSLKKTSEGKAWMGIQMTAKDWLVISSNTIRGTPGYEAGLDIDDKIETLDGQPVKTQQEVNTIIEHHKPGDKIGISYQHRGVEKTAIINLQEYPYVSVIPFEQSGIPVTNDILQFRKKWLGSKLK